MGRREQPQIKQRILERCVEHALEHGLPEHLEPLAAATDTSTRMLIYHFGTRDDLLRKILEHARRRQIELFTAMMQPRTGEPYTTTLAKAWEGMSGTQGEPYLRMFRRLHDTAGEPLWPNFRREATLDWLEPIEQGLATIGRSEQATLLLAVIRGLLIDLDATSDIDRTTKAFHQYLATIA